MDSDNEYAMLDSTIVRAHQQSVEKKEQTIGCSKGGLSTKIHTRTDDWGNPTGFYLTAGQAVDMLILQVTALVFYHDLLGRV